MDNTTQALDLVQRRCAALMTLSDVLEGESLMNALWMLEERDQSADKITFIGFFGVTAELLGINSNIITTLYSQLNKNLNLPNEELPEDPLPAMLKYRGIDGAEQPAPSKDKLESPIVSKQAVKKTKGTAEMTVCVSLMSNIVVGMDYPKTESYSLFKEVFLEEVTEAKLDDDVKQQMFSWVDILNNKAFKRNYSIENLCVIVHCVYIALCEAIGPVKADGIMKNAVNKTEKIPAAKKYSAVNFL